MITNAQLLIALFVPLLVSFILFKYLNAKANIKGKAIATGPLKDIQFDLGGAFAAYVILAGGLLYFFYYDAKFSREQVWLVKGRLEFEDASNTLSPVNISISTEPPNRVLEDGTFDLSVIIDTKNGLPIIKAKHDGFWPRLVHLKPRPGTPVYPLIIDESTRTIEIDSVIMLSPKIIKR